MRSGQDMALDEELDLKEEYRKVMKTLRGIGLSEYEARTYIALVAHGVGDAETIATTAKIPRTSSYKALQALCEKGFALAARGRPVVYKPEPPSKLKDRLVEDVSNTFGRLELIHELLMEKGEPQLVYTIAGKNRVMDKIGELLDGSARTFIISTPSLREVRKSLDKRFSAAAARGIDITFITEQFQRTPKGRNMRTINKQGLIATDVISDGERALIASPDLSACGYTDNPYLARHLESFLQILMKD